MSASPRILFCIILSLTASATIPATVLPADVLNCAISEPLEPPPLVQEVRCDGVFTLNKKPNSPTYPYSIWSAGKTGVLIAAGYPVLLHFRAINRGDEEIQAFVWPSAGLYGDLKHSTLDPDGLSITREGFAPDRFISVNVASLRAFGEAKDHRMAVTMPAGSSSEPLNTSPTGIGWFDATSLYPSVLPLFKERAWSDEPVIAYARPQSTLDFPNIMTKARFANATLHSTSSASYDSDLDKVKVERSVVISADEKAELKVYDPFFSALEQLEGVVTETDDFYDRMTKFETRERDAINLVKIGDTLRYEKEFTYPTQLRADHVLYTVKYPIAVSIDGKIVCAEVEVFSPVPVSGDVGLCEGMAQ